MTSMRLGVLAIAIVTATPAAAQWCAEPSRPYCLQYGRYDESCRMSVDEYTRQITLYKVCMDNQAQMRSLEARQRAEKEAGRTKSNGLSIWC